MVSSIGGWLWSNDLYRLFETGLGWNFTTSKKLITTIPPPPHPPPQKKKTIQNQTAEPPPPHPQKKHGSTWHLFLWRVSLFFLGGVGGVLWNHISLSKMVPIAGKKPVDLTVFSRWIWWFRNWSAALRRRCRDEDVFFRRDGGNMRCGATNRAKKTWWRIFPTEKPMQGTCTQILPEQLKWREFVDTTFRVVFHYYYYFFLEASVVDVTLSETNASSIETPVSNLLNIGKFFPTGVSGHSLSSSWKNVGNSKHSVVFVEKI